MNTEVYAEVGPMPVRIARREPVGEPPARAIEYLRCSPPSEPVPVADTSWRASTAAAVSAILSCWVLRLLVAWGLVTLASLVGPCGPPAPTSAWSASPEPSP